MPDTPEELRIRIVGHMNEDRKFTLFDFLEYFKGIKLDRDTDDVRMIDVNLDSMVISYTVGDSTIEETIPIVPAIGSYDDARHTLILLAKEAAGGLGFSAYQVDRYVPMRLIPYDLVPAAAIVALVLSTFAPQTILPYVAKVSPAVSRFLGLHAKKLFIGVSVIHLVEYLTALRPRFHKYRVPARTRVYWTLANFAQGYPVFSRFDEEVNRINH